MTKSELAWLLLRGAGLISLLYAVMNVAAIVYCVYLLLDPGHSELRKSLPEQMAWDLVWPKALWCIVYLAAGWYLLRNGRLIHRALMRE
jgi:hypothetical protein